MSALVRKEIRSLLPTFGAALLLTFTIWLIPRDASTPGLRGLLVIVPFGLCPALVVMMAVAAFGREMVSGTFANLLVQPMSRASVWRTKTLVLAGAMALVFVAWWLSFLLFERNTLVKHVEPQDLRALTLGTLLFVVAVFSGGLWTVLVFRQVAAAFWFTLLVPAALAMIAAYSSERFLSAAFIEAALIAVVSIYSVAGFLWARRLFLRAQDVQWTGGELALPGWLKLPRGSARTRAFQGRRPLRALLAKEFQLHQSQYVIAGVLALLHLALIVARKSGGGFKPSSAFEFVAWQFWALWPVMALLVGCAAVAEERKLGTLEAQLCLPVRRRSQFVIKLGVGLLLAIFFGVVAPVLFEGGRILPDFKSDFDPVQLLQRGGLTWGGFLQLVVYILGALLPLAPLLPLLIVAAVVLGISFYASTLARNTLQAITPAILGFVMIWGLVFGAQLIADSPNPLWRGPLIYLLGAPVLAVTLTSLAYWNFKRVFVGWPAWRRNLLTLLAALLGVSAATTAIYHRTWELFARLEPAHGTPRLSQQGRPMLETSDGSFLTARLPDGRLWQARRLYGAAPEQGFTLTLFNPRFLGGSNWTYSATPIRQTETAAIRDDGSLWLIETPAHAATWSNNRPVKADSGLARLTRIGTETTWHRVIRELWSPAFLLLKTDGTLWEWGTNRFDSRQKWPGSESFGVRKLGAGADWAEILCVGNSLYLWKTNGQAWAVNPIFRGPKSVPVELASGFQVERYPDFDRLRWRSLSTGQPFQVGVREDGTLWGFGLMVRVFQNPNLSNGQIGLETNWVAAACAGTTAVAMKSDGSLWKWDFAFHRYPTRRAALPTRLSSHADWVAVTGNWDGITCLAADGSLWHWRLEAWPTRFGRFEFPPMLAASRRPQRLGNVFDAAP